MNSCPLLMKRIKIKEFRRLIQKSLRNSDVMVEVSNTQIFLLLPETHETGVHVVIDRLINNWNLSQYHNKATISWEAGPVHLAGHESSESQHDTQTRDS